MNVVQAFDPLCEVQSDKASVEITSPFDGVVNEILVKEGDVAKVGEPLCIIETEEDALGPSDPNPETDTSLPNEETHTISAMSQIQGLMESRGPASALSSQRRPHPLNPNIPQDFANPSVAYHMDVLATPSVRYFARLKGVNLADISPGSGRDGRIERRDVEAFLSRKDSDEINSLGASDRSSPETDIDVELGRTRYGMWKAMEKVCLLISSFLLR